MLVEVAYWPKERFSVSQLDLWQSCPRAWGLRYLRGVRTPEISLDECVALKASGFEVPRRMQTLARGKALGGLQECYLKGEIIDWYGSDIARRAVVGLPHLPDPRAVRWIGVENALTFDLQTFAKDPPAFAGAQDFVWLDAEGWHLGDHKTTIDWKWAKSAADLEKNDQALLYAEDVFQLAERAGVPIPGALHCRWVYYRTEGTPAARPVDFWITREMARARVAHLVNLACEVREVVRQYMRGEVQVDDLSVRPGHCRAFGGCPYHTDNGGPCDARFRFIGGKWLT